ncbi:hypothetical protein BDR06DRAFT_1062805 [Suillus hirtellus]|nr:hypothetical protein BDR06DRAFT_1062805 [Suillus hirtellus]
MAQESSSHTNKAVWTDTEADQLLLYLFNNRDKITDTRNFKDVMYNSAAEHGLHKTGVMCKMKWGSTYNTIQKYHQLSGVHWDNIRGANIEGEGATAVWNEYILRKGNSGMHPFCVSGWRHYKWMDSIIPQDSVHDSTTSFPSASVSMRHEEPGVQTPPPPSESGSMKKPKMTSGRTQAQSISTKDTKTSDTKMSKTTTAVAVMGT